MKVARSARVLIADDEANIRLVLGTALKAQGYAVDEATNGREALAAIERQPPDVMILDLSMPVLDGMGVLQELRGTGRGSSPHAGHPRVIVLTAYGSIPTAVRATRLGADDVLEKPVSFEEVREAVEAVLQGQGPEPTVGPPGDEEEGGYAALLGRVREALRLAHDAAAESLLLRAADLGRGDAAYFNLLGVLYEARRDWDRARKFYGKAIRADRRYEPAQANMRRIYELYTFGTSKVPVTLGDEVGV